MSEIHSLALVDEDEYGLIESAVLESGRGRRFLAEYARRNRSADTDMLLGAIGRLENTIARDRSGDEVGRMRGDLMEMAQAIGRTRAEIAAIQPPDQDQSRLTLASEALDAIVRATETATSDILGAAEQIQEAAWTLREGGAAAEVCNELDRRATQIYTACSFQDITAQRTSRVVHTLRYLEDRLAAMIAIWGQDSEGPPPAPASAAPADLCQSDVDHFLQSETQAETPVAPRRPTAGLAVPLDDDLAFLPKRIDEPEPIDGPEPFDEPEPIDEPEPTAAFDQPEPEADVVWDAADGGEDDDILPESGPTGSDSALQPPSEPTAPQAPAIDARGDEDLSSAFGDFDHLSIEEKLALFS